MSKRLRLEREGGQRPSSPPTGMVTAVILVLLGVMLGMLVAGGVRTVYRMVDPESRVIQVERDRAMARVAVGFAVTWRALAAMAAIGFGVRVSQWMGKQLAVIYPNRAGIFPVVRLRTGPVVTLHDPNRSTAAIVSYSRVRDAAEAVVIPTDQPGQATISMGALAVQHAAAVHRWQLPPGAPVRESVRTDGHGHDAPDGEPTSSSAAWPEAVALQSVLEEPITIGRLALGVTVDEQTGARVVVRDSMQHLVHVAVGGSSGFGKSVFLRALTYQLALAQEQPDLVLVDLEGVTLAPFAQCGRLLYPLAQSEDDAVAVLRALSEEELDRRRDLFARYPGIDSLEEYNAQTGEQLRPIVTVIDEGTALLGDRDVETALKTLTLRARKFGLWVVIAGQDWKSSSLDSAIRNQLATRVQFRAMNPAQSRVLLGVSGAESLPAEPKGRALAQLPGRGLLEMQTPYVSRREIQTAVSNGGPVRDLPVVESGPTEAERIAALARQGLSLAAIAQRVFGYEGGAAYRKVKAVLSTTTTARG